MRLEKRKLGSTGFNATVLGIGDLADRAVPLEKCVATIHQAMDFGLNLIDTAPGQVQLGWERDWFRTSAAAVIAVSTSRGFEPPGPQKRLEAIGTTDGLAAVLQRALAPNASFQPVPVP